MGNARKILLVCGLLMLALVVKDIIAIVSQFSEVSVAMTGFSEIERIAAVVVGVILGVGALLKLWLGYQAVSYGCGRGKGRSHIVLAKIVFVLLILSTVASLAESMEVMSLITSLVSVALMLVYIKAAKACLD